MEVIFLGSMRVKKFNDSQKWKVNFPQTPPPPHPLPCPPLIQQFDGHASWVGESGDILDFEICWKIMDAP